MSRCAREWARDCPDLGMAEAFVLWAMADTVDEAGVYRRPQAALAAVCRMTDRGLRNALASLRDRGLIEAVKGGTGAVVHWRLKVGATPEPRSAVSKPRKDVPRSTPEPRSYPPERRSVEPRNHVPTELESNQREQESPHSPPEGGEGVPPPAVNGSDLFGEPTAPPPAPPKRGRADKDRAYTEDFAWFWQSYPRPVGKPQAFKAFQAALKRGVDVIDIIDALHRDTTGEWANRPADKIPHPATWLNRDPWDQGQATPSTATRSHEHVG